MRKSTELFGAAWREFMLKPKLYVSIYLLPVLLSFLFIFFDETSEADMASWEMLAVAALVIVTMIVNILMGVALILAASGRVQTVTEAYRTSIKYLVRYFLVGLLGGLAVFGGLLLLIVPGIILAVWFSQSYMISVLEDQGVIASLKRSKEYVTGKWWAVAGRIAFLGLVIILMTVGVMIVVGILSTFVSDEVASLLVYLTNLVIVPLSMIYSYQLYSDLAGRNTLADMQPGQAAAPLTDPVVQ